MVSISHFVIFSINEVNLPIQLIQSHHKSLPFTQFPNLPRRRRRAFELGSDDNLTAVVIGWQPEELTAAAVATR